MEPVSSARRYDVDWLRVFAAYLLFIVHTAKIFDPEPFYHIRNTDLSFGILLLVDFIVHWYMPLFFVLAGWSVFASLQTRGTASFLKERVQRLLIPLVVGCVLFGPIIKYVELRSGFDLRPSGLRVSAALQDSFRAFFPAGLQVATPFSESFVEFLPTFFKRLNRFTWSHLWFLAYLFTFSVLYCPLFAWLARTRDRLARSGAVWVYVPIIPLAVIQITLRRRWPCWWNLYDDWANFAYYSTYLLAGFLLARSPALERAVHREWRRALGIGLGAAGIFLGSTSGVVRSPAIAWASTAVAGWCCVVALLGFARSRPAHSSAVLAYLTESAFPIYILHHPAIVVLGYVIIQLPLGIGAKFVLVLLASLMVTMAVYHFIVRPVPILRFLLGMKPRADARRVSVLLVGTATRAAGG